MVKKNKLGKENIVFLSMLLGVILLSIGIYLIGIKAGSIGKTFAILGSLLLYVSVVSLVFIT